jgi:hypothetical protein
VTGQVVTRRMGHLLSLRVLLALLLSIQGVVVFVCWRLFKFILILFMTFLAKSANVEALYRI